MTGPVKIKQITALPFTVWAPWPPHTLSPNARIHWSRLQRYKRDYKTLCMQEFMGQGMRGLSLPEGLRLSVHMEFTPPLKRDHDADNLVARAKYLIDALATLIQHDDKNFNSPTVTVLPADRKAFGVVVTVAVAE